jgi:hypothetical protein
MPRKKNVNQPVQTSNDLPTMEGLVLRWVNPAARNRSISGWKCWRPVSRESDVGQTVAEHLEENTFRFGEVRQDSDYFWRGDMLLAFAPIDEVEALRKANVSNADRQLEMVVEEHRSRHKIRKMSVSRITEDES